MKSKSGQVGTAMLVIGAAAVGLYAIYKNNQDSSGSSDGSGFGGSDDMGDQNDSYVYVGGDSSVNDIVPTDNLTNDDGGYLTGYYDLTNQQSVIGEIQSDEPIYDPFGLWTDPTTPSDTKASDNGMSYWNPESPSTDVSSQSSGLSSITPAEWLLGAAGMAGSYGSAFGESLLKKSGKGILSDTFEGGLKSIPFGQGEKAAKFVIGSSDDAATEVAEYGSNSALKALASNIDEAAELGVKSSSKGLTTLGKIGVSAIPFIGIVASAEFTTAFDGRSRYQTYPVETVADIVGGLGGAIVGLFTANPLGVAAGAVGGQIVVSNALYAGIDHLNDIKASVQSGYNTVSQFVTSPIAKSSGNANKQSSSKVEVAKASAPTAFETFVSPVTQSVAPTQSVSTSPVSSSSSSKKKSSSSKSSSAKNAGTTFLDYTGTNKNQQSKAPTSTLKSSNVSSQGVSANIGYKTVNTAFGTIVVKK